MATVQDIVTRAYRKIGIVAIDEDLNADMAQEGLDAFNEMVMAWELQGVVPDKSFSEALLTDTFPMSDRFRDPVVHLLAARLAQNHGVAVGYDPDDHFRAIQADLVTWEGVTFDPGLTTSTMRRTGWNI
jgi:hypothetical protein